MALLGGLGGHRTALEAVEGSRSEARRSEWHLRADIERRLESGETNKTVDKVGPGFAQREPPSRSELVYMS